MAKKISDREQQKRTNAKLQADFDKASPEMKASAVGFCHTAAHQEDQDRLEFFYARDLQRRQDKLASARETMTAHAARVSTDPVYAMDWADESFEAAGVVAVYSRLLVLADGFGLDRAKVEAQKELLNQSFEPRSTSACRNLLDAYKSKALAAFVKGGF